jgi:hypothetical protein
MSALQVERNSFSAHLALPAGVAVSITAPTLNDLQLVVTKLQPSANDINGGGPQTPAPKPEKPAGKAAAPSPTPAPTSAPAPVPGAESGSASGESEVKRPTYDDVKERVLKLAKLSREKATELLSTFGVDHANKLKLEDYPKFIGQADEILKAGAK